MFTTHKKATNEIKLQINNDYEISHASYNVKDKIYMYITRNSEQ